MRKSILSKLAATVLAGFLAVGAFPSAGSEVYAGSEGGGSIVLKASELNKQIKNEGGTYIDSEGHLNLQKGMFDSVELVLDEDLHLDESIIFADVTLSGNYSLYMDRDFKNCDLTIEGDFTIKQDAELVIDSDDCDINVYKYNSAGGNLNVYGYISFCWGNDIYAAHNINVYSGRIATEMSSDTKTEDKRNKSYILNSEYDINISGGCFECKDKVNSFLSALNNIEISGGEFDVKSSNSAIYADNDLSITGGKLNVESETENAIITPSLSISDYANVTANSNYFTVSCNKFAFDGGYFETNYLGDGNYPPINVGSDDIKIGDDCQISQPENGMVKLGEGYYSIFDEDGNIPQQVILEEKFPEEVTPPEPITGLVYNGKEQELIKPGMVGDTPLEYQVKTVFDGYKYPWTDKIPTALDALDYEVSYRAKGKSKVLGKVDVRIECKDVTVTADDIESYVGEDLKELTYKIEGLAEGDTEEDLGLVEPSCEADKYKAGTYPIIIRMNDTYVSYRITEVNGTYTVKNKSYTVDFDTDGGSKIDPVIVEMGEKLAKPADPVKDGFAFDGWYYKDRAYDFSQPVITSFTLTAKWKKNETPDDPKDDPDDKKYSNEWVDGKWYDADGKCTYDGILSWKQNATGWWVEDSKGWYPVSQWQKIDGKWYYFTADGYMDYSEYRDGCWLGADGAWDEKYSGGHWMNDSTGWWYEDASGWYPQNQWVWIDGSCYYFGADGYMLTNRYVDGCWVGEDGAWVK